MGGGPGQPLPPRVGAGARRGALHHRGHDAPGLAHPGLGDHVGERLPAGGLHVARDLQQARCLRGELSSAHRAQHLLAAAEHHQRQRARRQRRGRKERQDPFHSPLHRLRIGHPGQARCGARDRQAQALDPLATHGHRGDDLHPQTARQQRGVDRHPPRVGLVHHVQAEDEGQSRLAQLESQEHRALQVLRVPHGDDAPRPPGQQDVAGDALVLGGREQGAGSRRVQHRDLVAAEDGRARGHLHRRPRVVGDGDVAAGEGAEQDALPHVGIADEGDGPFPWRRSGERGDRFGHVGPSCDRVATRP
jgi:hypothetical protein